MSQKKVYKINENQLKLIVGSQKTNSPQLQTEMLDATAAAFTKLISWGFKQSIAGFKYMTGVGVNIFYGDRYTPTGKYPVKKTNWLLPLGLYKPTLVGMPQNYQNLFKTLYTGMQSIDSTGNQQGEVGDTNNETLNLDTLSTNLKFDDVQGIVYNIKFQFTNLKKEAKENAELMMTTWALVFNVDCQGKVTDNNTMKWTLVGFSSQGPSISQFLSAAAKGKGDNEGEGFLKALSKIAGASTNASTNQLSLIFSNTSQAQKFAKAMTQQINNHMKVIIGQTNANMGQKNTIKQPQVTVTVDPKLIGDSKIQETQTTKPLEEIENDLREIARQIDLYKDQEQYKNHINQLKYVFNRLLIQREQIKQK